MDIGENRAGFGLFGLAADRAQRFFQRRDRHQRGELAGEQRKLLGAELGGEQRDAAGGDCGAAGRSGGVGTEPDHVPLALRQLLARLRLARRLDRTAAFGTLRVDGEVGEAGHQASTGVSCARVIRAASSGVVSPASTNARAD